MSTHNGKKTPPSNLKQGNLFSFFKKKTPPPPPPTTSSTASSASPRPGVVSQTPPTSTPMASKPSVASPASTTAIGTTSATGANATNGTTSAGSATTSATSTAKSKSSKAPVTNTLWKTVQVGDTIRIWWVQDRQYYAATVVQQRTEGSMVQFCLRYDDGESEWTDLSIEKFQVLETNKRQTNTKKRHIEESDSEQEFEFQDDDGSEFEANDEDEDEDDEDDDQSMVTDDDDDDVDDPEEPAPPKRKKAKTANTKLLVTEHRKPTGSSTSPASTSRRQAPPAPSTTSASFKTPLRPSANTVSPSTTSSHANTSASKKTVPGPPPATPSVPSVGKVTSSPQKAIPFTKGALNVQGAHLHNHLSFLQHPRDNQGRQPSDPDYDPRTLKVNALEWERFNGGKMTDAVQQWWDLKSQYFDTVLLFKTGKFYEMFHMDADVGVEVLGLSYMKGHVAHAGFPEVGYGPAADKLVRAGYKVARVEQTETPEQLKERKAKMTKGQKKPAVVNREVCSILSLGTRTFCALDDKDILAEVDSVENNKTGGPLLTIAENMLDPATTIPKNSPDDDGDDDSQVQAVCEYGITLVDAVRATVTVGQFADDVLRSRLNTLLARLAPSEILLSESASPTLVGLVKTFQRSNQCRYEVVRDQETFPKSTALEASHRQQLERKTLTVHPWSVPETLAELHRRAYYPRASKTSDSIQRWPAVLQALVQGEAKLALSSFGASLFFLQRHLIDQEILSMGIVKAYIPESSSNIPSPTPLSLPDSREEDDMEVDSATPAAGLSSIPVTSSAEEHITHLSLDGTTLHNLEILTNAVDQKVAGSLWSKINYCKSPHGARFLRAWLLRPLFKKSEIDRRADAVQELASGAGAVALHEARQTVLGKVGDLDRLLSRIHSMSGSVTNAREDDATAGYHPNERAVLYENATYTKRKVNDFSKALTGLRRACQIPEIFADLQQLDPKGLLFKIVKSKSAGGCFPEMAEELDWFFDNFDCEQAAQGHFEPSRGVDEAYDHACDTIDRVHAELEAYKKEMCREISPRQGATIGWKYINTAPESKDKYLIELPATIRVPDDFLVKGKRGAGHKQVNKYRTSVVAGLVLELERALEIQSARKAKGMQLIFAKFDSMRSVWSAAAHAAAMLDALGSLAKVAAKPGYCRPTILDCPSDQPPLIDIVQGRHPCVEGSSIHSAEFIPNDLKLGGKPDDDNDAARLLLLSGPNMGGKSTLLRQTCLISILAQMGSFVPAESCSLTPVDCIYTRLGASDRILLGQSTFFVELAETAAALRGATRRSLVIMDELGRGTSTFDGTAIAGATVKHLIERSQCLTLFATHYHSLLDEWKNEPMVRLGHMQCMVEGNSEDGETEPSTTTTTNDHSITFLYTLGPGTCPKSFGINVARLASLPAEVLDNAKRVSQEFEAEMVAAHLRHQDSSVKEKVLAAINKGDWDELERLWHEMKSASS